jgi:hypothetical protein
LIDNNSFPEVVEWAEQLNEEAEILKEEAQVEMDQAVDNGATPYLFEYIPPGAEVEPEGYEPPEAEVDEAAGPKDVLSGEIFIPEQLNDQVAAHDSPSQ